MPYPRAATCVDPESSVRGGPTLTTLNAGLLALLFFRGSGPILLRNPKLCDFSVCVCVGGVSGPLVPHSRSLHVVLKRIRAPVQFHITPPN